MNKQIFNTAAAVVVAAVFCIGCGNGGGGGSKPSNLTGQWVEVKDGGELGEEMELLSDGTLAVKEDGISVSGTWKIVDNRLVMSVSVLGTDVSQNCNYKLSGSELTLVDNDNDTTVYIKKEKLEEFMAKRVAEEAKQATRAIEQLGQNFVFVPVQGGTFTMGCTPEQGNDCERDEKPAHSVTLKNFSISKYEVTQVLWKAVMGENPSKFEGDDLPVEQVSWNDIQKFIQKLNEKTGKKYRLPTEAEWEYAARGGNKSKGYKYSGGNEIGDVAWYGDNGGGTTHTVGGKQANELGIYDMTGNVWEWVNDLYGKYSSDAQTNPTGPAWGPGRVLRGGSWNGGARICRVSIRDQILPDSRDDSLGFRLVLSS